MDLETYLEIMTHPVTFPVWNALTASFAYTTYQKIKENSPAGVYWSLATLSGMGHIAASGYNLLEILVK
ncbi:hypothetical protein CL616_02600 [archaeon]|nr:hypothetical protein [archaeon]|tara:strand:- start:145 stop:351 length:207 start_codon:yes stop_codon:yes gene_type:complete